MNKDVKILYVDDELINTQLFEINLRKKYTIFTALNAMEGFDVLTENPDIDIVISDMKMPLINGIEFIKKAKLIYPKISFYILTGYEITDEIQEALSSGIILKYFQKPFNLNEIDEEINNALTF